MMEEISVPLRQWSVELAQICSVSRSEARAALDDPHNQPIWGQRNLAEAGSALFQAAVANGVAAAAAAEAGATANPTLPPGAAAEAGAAAKVQPTLPPPSQPSRPQPQPRGISVNGGPLISLDDGATWTECSPDPHAVAAAGHISCLSLGFGSNSIARATESLCARSGVELIHPPFLHAYDAIYDHYLPGVRTRSGGRSKTHYDYAKEVIAPHLRGLVQSGRGPSCLLAGRRGGQETILYIWRHVWRGPTIVVNSGCGAIRAGQ